MKFLDSWRRIRHIGHLLRKHHVTRLSRRQMAPKLPWQYQERMNRESTYAVCIVETREVYSTLPIGSLEGYAAMLHEIGHAANPFNWCEAFEGIVRTDANAGTYDLYEERCQQESEWMAWEWAMEQTDEDIGEFVIAALSTYVDEYAHAAKREEIRQWEAQLKEVGKNRPFYTMNAEQALKAFYKVQNEMGLNLIEKKGE